MHCVLNILSEYTYFYISKNSTSYTFFLLFKIVESLQCILNPVVQSIYLSINPMIFVPILNLMKKSKISFNSSNMF